MSDPIRMDGQSNYEKYQLLLDSCDAIAAMSGRVTRMAQGYATFIRGGDGDLEGRGLDIALMVLHPYVAMLFDSEEGLGDPANDREKIYSVLQRLRAVHAASPPEEKQ